MKANPFRLLMAILCVLTMFVFALPAEAGGLLGRTFDFTVLAGADSDKVQFFNCGDVAECIGDLNAATSDSASITVHISINGTSVIGDADYSVVAYLLPVDVGDLTPSADPAALTPAAGLTLPQLALADSAVATHTTDGTAVNAVLTVTPIVKGSHYLLLKIVPVSTGRPDSKLIVTWGCVSRKYGTP